MIAPTPGRGEEGDSGGPVALSEKKECVYPSYKFPMYAATKTLAEGCLDTALLIQNVGEMKMFLSKEHPAPVETFLAVMSVISVILLIVVGAILLVTGFLEKLGKMKKKPVVDMLNTITTALTFIIVVVNAFIAGFKA